MDGDVVEKIAKLAQQAAGTPEDLSDELSLPYDGGLTPYTFKTNTTENGRTLGEIVKPPRPEKLLVATLTGFIDAIAAGIVPSKEGVLKGRVIHVEDPLTVSVKAAVCDIFGVRDTLLMAKHSPAGEFKVDEYISSERFLIQLQTCFLRIDGDDFDYVQKVCSNLKAGDTVHAQDDGVNQRVTLQVGKVEAGAIDVNLKARVRLTPLRTFAEAAPIESEFLLRLKPNPNGLPMVALFGLEGDKWKGLAMQSIKKYLKDNLPTDVAILA